MEQLPPDAPGPWVQTAPSPPAAPAASAPSGRFGLSGLLRVLALLVALLVLPYVVKKIQYAKEFGKQRARMDVALDGLEELNLERLSLASRAVAHAVGPSVVRILTHRPVELQANDKEDRRLPFHSDRLEAEGQGSGVIVDDDGFVVTNEHVVNKAASIDVILSDGRLLPARLIGGDSYTDIAVLKVPGGDLIAAGWGSSDELETGDMVWAVGSPYRLEGSVSFGIVSAKGREGNHFQDLLQTDAAVNPGNSGGPLVNIQGQIVGINTAIWGGKYQGISFAVPSGTARDVYERLRSDGKVARGWLGVVLKDTYSERDNQPDDPAMRGVLVDDVQPKSPAESAGIRKNDVIVQWDGKDTREVAALIRMVGDTEIGSVVDVKVVRDQKPLVLQVTVGERKI